MYPPAHFVCADGAQIAAFLQQQYFGLLLTAQPQLQLTPLPFLFDLTPGRQRAFCHMARNNPQLSQLENQQVTIVIQGPHAFVAASCYEKQPAVSTWNYVMVELQGKARLMAEAETLTLVRRQEAHSAPTMMQSADYQQKLVAAIVGVDIELTDIQGRFKLSQNKTPAERQRVQQFLQQTEQPLTLWQLMG